MVDEQAWSSGRPTSRSTSPAHSTSGTSFGALGNRRTSLGVTGLLPPSSSKSSSSTIGANGSSTNEGTSSNRTVFSLDDYASRMRMAAIMLSQLTASETFSKGYVATSATAAGQLVGLPVTVVTGLGGVVGGVVGAGLGAMLGSRMPFGGASTRKAVEQAGQGSSGVTVGLDLSSAVEGTSDVSGIPSTPTLPSSIATSTSATKSTPTTTIPHERQRVLSPIEATAIRNRIMGEMMALEEERMERMRDDGRVRSGWTAGAEAGVEDEAVVLRAVNKDDPSGSSTFLLPFRSFLFLQPSFRR